MKSREDYLRQYQEMHEAGSYIFIDQRVEADVEENLFNGMDFARALWGEFKEWGLAQESFRVLDFGSGKARNLYGAYLDGRTFHEHFAGRVQSYYCYDPGYRKYSQPPAGKFDAVICCDVLEHVREADVDAALLEMKSWLEEDGIAFINIGGNLSRVRFPDGENIHITIKPAEYWHEKMKLLDRRYVMRHVGKGIITTRKQ